MARLTELSAGLDQIQIGLSAPADEVEERHGHEPTPSGQHPYMTGHGQGDRGDAVADSSEVFRSVYRMVRSVMDPSVALALLILGLPVLVAIALAIRLDSPGSALFRQKRVGRNGRRFTILKFRTLSVDAPR